MAEAPWLDVVLEDPQVLVLNKPSGLLCVPGRGPDKQDCLSARALQRWPDALVVHRLDQPTSGLVLMARTPEAQRLLSDGFAQRRMYKRYRAVVQGLLPDPSNTGSSPGTGDDADGWGLIDLPLIADWPRRPLQKVCYQDGKPSQTRWRVLARCAQTGTTAVELQPITGRSHQLRLHMASIGYPMVGDALYADAATQARASRLLLHATELGFTHPASQAWIQLSAPPVFEAPFDYAPPLPSHAP